MDALAALLDGPRARGSFLLRMMLSAPWSIRIEDEAPLSVIAMVSGSACVLADDPNSQPLWLLPGDVLLARGPERYTVADGPTTPPQVVIHPGQRCTNLTGDDMAEMMGLGVRTWGNSQNGPTSILLGTYDQMGGVGRRLLAALPPLVALSEEHWGDHLIPLLRTEIVRDAPGQAAVLDRLIDLVLIAVLRAWFERDDAAPQWYRAQTDPVVGRAIGLLQGRPAHAWTLQELAAQTFVSRAFLARRFKSLAGEAPMAFLRHWRLDLASDLLQSSDATIAGIAAEVGYGSPFALSAAFKRAYGVSPADYRLRAHRAAPSARRAAVLDECPEQ